MNLLLCLVCLWPIPTHIPFRTDKDILLITSVDYREGKALPYKVGIKWTERIQVRRFFNRYQVFHRAETVYTKEGVDWRYEDDVNADRLPFGFSEEIRFKFNRINDGSKRSRRKSSAGH